MSYTTSDDMIRDVLAKCFWPETDGLAPLSHARIMQVADQVVIGEVWPEVVLAHADMYIHTTDYTLATTTSAYRLPKNVYGPIRSISYIDGDEEVSVPIMDVGDIARTANLSASPCGFHAYLHGDFFSIYPLSEATGTVRVRYFKHPSRLCAVSAATTIASMTLGSDQLTLTANSGSWTTSSYLDVVSAGSAHQVMLDYGDVSAVSTLLFTFSDDLAAFKGQVGDFVATTGYTPILQVPDHYAPATVALVAAACLRADRDLDAARAQDEEARRLMSRAQSLIVGRTVDQSTIIRASNSPYRMR